MSKTKTTFDCSNPADVMAFMAMCDNVKEVEQRARKKSVRFYIPGEFKFPPPQYKSNGQPATMVIRR